MHLADIRVRYAHLHHTSRVPGPSSAHRKRRAKRIYALVIGDAVCLLELLEQGGDGDAVGRGDGIQDDGLAGLERHRVVVVERSREIWGIRGRRCATLALYTSGNAPVSESSHLDALPPSLTVLDRYLLRSAQRTVNVQRSTSSESTVTQ